MGVQYKGYSPTHRSLRENINSLEKDSLFKPNGNHFGEVYRRSAERCNIYSDNPIATAKQFFDQMGYGGAWMDYIGGRRVRLRDGTIINYRETSKSSGPAVDISIKGSNDNCGIRTHRIHFIHNSERDKK